DHKVDQREPPDLRRATEGRGAAARSPSREEQRGAGARWRLRRMSGEVDGEGGVRRGSLG
ncbi:unnamed protein product, partial [Durusdinium trenchii]